MSRVPTCRQTGGPRSQAANATASTATPSNTAKIVRSTRPSGPPPPGLSGVVGRFARLLGSSSGPRSLGSKLETGPIVAAATGLPTVKCEGMPTSPVGSNGIQP